MSENLRIMGSMHLNAKKQKEILDLLKKLDELQRKKENIHKSDTWTFVGFIAGCALAGSFLLEQEYYSEGRFMVGIIILAISGIVKYTNRKSLGEIHRLLWELEEPLRSSDMMYFDGRLHIGLSKIDPHNPESYAHAASSTSDPTSL